MGSQRQHYDAIIVGGGPAGSTLARKMVQKGWKTLILDKETFPRVKLCAGWITPPVLDHCEIDPVEYARSFTLQQFRGFNISKMSGVETRVEYPNPVSFGIIRSEFDHFLLRRSGADIVEGVKVGTLLREGGEWKVNDQWQAPLLVGAGGHYCPVAQHLGVQKRFEKNLSTLELELELESHELASYGVNPECPDLVYFDDIRGYGWCFRKGSFMNVGVGRTKSRNLKDFLEAFLAVMERRGKIPPNSRFEPRLFKGHAYKLHFVTPRPYVSEGALLIGDAAGLAYNYSGEGIRPAVESSLLAWETLSDRDGDFSREALEPYRRKVFDHFGEPVTGLRFRIMESLPPACFQTIGRTIFSSHRLKRLFLEKWFIRGGRQSEPSAPWRS